VLGWLERFPRGLSRRDPRLLLMRAWMLSLSGRREAAEDAIATLERIGWPAGRGLSGGARPLEAGPAPLGARGSLGGRRRGGRGRRAGRLESPGSAFWTGVLWSLGMGCYYDGDLEEADRHFAEAVESGSRNEQWLAASSALAYRSLIAGERGEIETQRLLVE